ncbi:MAG: SUMF1/EgtB/PvdO family nonheme iron enzyme, partial [Phycisphaerales bacterium]|nr:SUMF1/EgtB/PvdO family nonheme iron enzyme [Phycisphaerales bacterium]
MTTTYGIEFSTVDPRNAPPIAPSDLGPGSGMAGRGSGLQPFRMARTEVTNGQWLEFANTFIPNGDPFNMGVRYNLSTDWIFDEHGQTIGIAPNEGLPYPGSSMAASGISFLNAARYCNWLTNGRQSTIGSTMTGAYDLTGITDADVSQVVRSPGALFWIPSLDEWMAAAYYQPGPGGGPGAWNAYPISSSTLPIPGLPRVSGAQTSAGIDILAVQEHFVAAAIPAALYPNSQSPWGLFDMSGGVNEMTDNAVQHFPAHVFTLGSSWNDDNDSWTFRDRLGYPDSFAFPTNT